MKYINGARVIEDYKDCEKNYYSRKYLQKKISQLIFKTTASFGIYCYIENEGVREKVHCRVQGHTPSSA